MPIFVLHVICPMHFNGKYLKNRVMQTSQVFTQRLTCVICAHTCMHYINQCACNKILYCSLTKGIKSLEIKTWYP